MHTGSGALGTRFSPRDSSGSSDKLSTGSIIAIVVVCACVGILLFALFVWRILIRCCRPSRPAPLPPVQELAHRREQQAATLQQQAASRPTTWLSGSVNNRGSHALYSTSSAASLLPGPNGPQRKSSIHTDEATTAESSSSSPSDPANPLQPPNPAFFGTPLSSPHDSTVSLGASTSSPTPSPVPFSETSSTGSHSHPMRPSSSHSSQARPSRSRSNFRQDGDRRLSVVSSTGTTYSSHTVRSGNIIRGAPHGPHSSIQIVLPAPLASHSLNSEDVLSDGRSVRSSIHADQWVNAGSRHASVDGGDRGRGRGRHTVNDRRPSSQPARASTDNGLRRRRSSPELPPLPTSAQQRSMSQPRPQTRQHVYTPPPVPRIPEGYDYPAAEASSSERGRSAQQRPTVAIAIPQPTYGPVAVPPPQLAPSPASTSPTQPHKSRVLRKSRPPTE